MTSELDTGSLSYLVDAIQGELGDVVGLFTPTLIERFVNEGQRKLEPELLREMTATATWDAGADTYDLPDDFAQLVAFDPDGDSDEVPTRFRIHGGTLYFDQRSPSVPAYSGRLFYRAHWPQITVASDCLLPGPGRDALVDYGLYKCFHRIAANRSEYRRYATMAQNGVSVADLEAIAQNHLADFGDVKKAAQMLPEPSYFYEQA